MYEKEAGVQFESNVAQEALAAMPASAQAALTANWDWLLLAMPKCAIRSWPAPVCLILKFSSSKAPP
eukprot:scaffold266727_cov32-Tisochrysis_lutea.AAC.3